MTLITFTSGTKAKSSEVNSNFDFVDALVPIGIILPWAKTLTGVPALSDNFVECNGQVLSDAESPLDGQTIPDLNGDNRFLRGNSTSGGAGGATSHTHTTDDASVTSGGASRVRSINPSDHLPPYYDVVWIMRVK